MQATAAAQGQAGCWHCAVMDFMHACMQTHVPLHDATQDLDGIILVIDPQRPEQEKELETFYMNFAQPNSLTIKQCLVLAIQVVKEGSYGLVGWNGERSINLAAHCFEPSSGTSAGSKIEDVGAAESARHLRP